ncbi:MAG TPA: DNA repair protein RadC [Candidatus Aerophobetes bacterium]|uniref:DNA repair protein RadC n=1 Tax=Aerophobetes bacterium TaxID=2030807 RepID=A0A7V0N0F6_UNCAE|nr:DNA repair protein RadC [Candidatus Aerophobetes bacterium]
MNEKVKPHYIGHRERLRKRFQRAGSKGMHDYELLELLLTYAIPRKDVKPVAKQLIKKFGSFSGVFDASMEELKAIRGVGSVSAILIKVVKEIFCSYLAEEMKKKDLVSSPQAAVDFARVKLSGLPNEAFMIIYLNTKNEVIDSEIIQEGTVDRAVIYPRRIIESALGHHAKGLLLVHNHPSGYPEPSNEDRRITQTISEAVKTVDIKVVDHIIVGKYGYFSFAERGIL